jgi:hypothetical protein
VRVDFEEVCPSALNIRDVEMMLGHVIVIGKEVYHRLGDLDVKVIIPWKDLGWFSEGY